MKSVVLLLSAAILAGCGYGSTEKPTLGDLSRGVADLATARRIAPPADWPRVCREVRPLALPPAGSDTDGWTASAVVGAYKYRRSGQRFVTPAGAEIGRQTNLIEVDYVGPRERNRAYAGGPWRCPD